MLRATTSSDRRGRLGRALEWIKRRVGRGDDMAGFSPAELGHMADDLGIGAGDVVALASRAADNTPLMLGMMRAHGLEPAAMRDGFPVLMRDIERVCTQCRNVKRCRRQQDTGTAAEHAHEFCPNAGTFDDIADYTMGH